MHTIKMIKNITITVIITTETERPMISLLLYLFSSLVLSSKVELIFSVSLTIVGLGLTVFTGLLLSGPLSSSTMAGIGVMKGCDNVTVGVGVAVVDGDGLGVVVCTVKQNNTCHATFHAIP